MHSTKFLFPCLPPWTYQFLESSDWDSEILPQNMVPWHIEYFKSKRQLQEGLSDLPLLLLRQIIRLSSERKPPSTWRKGASFSERWKDTRRNLNEEDLLSFPQFTTLSSCPFVLSHFPQLSTLHQTQYKNTQL